MTVASENNQLASTPRSAADDIIPCVAAYMFLVPLVTGFCVSRLIAEPAFEFMQHRSPLAFAPSDRQKASIMHGKLISLRRSALDQQLDHIVLRVCMVHGGSNHYYDGC